MRITFYTQTHTYSLSLSYIRTRTHKHIDTLAPTIHFRVHKLTHKHTLLHTSTIALVYHDIAHIIGKYLRDSLNPINDFDLCHTQLLGEVWGHIVEEERACLP